MPMIFTYFSPFRFSLERKGASWQTRPLSNKQQLHDFSVTNEKISLHGKLRLRLFEWTSALGTINSG
jgi:hypothetical protein